MPDASNQCGGGFSCILLQTKVAIKQLLPLCLGDSQSKVRASVVSTGNSKNSNTSVPFLFAGICHLCYSSLGLAGGLVRPI